MRRALRRAALALLAASVPGLSRPAVAQSLPPVVTGAVPPAEAAREGHGRLEEMKVEMAWLADPATFACPLAARAAEGGMQLNGHVPTAALREKAIKIAKAHTRLPVVSLLTIDPAVPPRETGVGADAVRQGAAEVLNGAFGMTARGFDIHAEDDGRVAVSGSVNSVEEKLAVSRWMRKVRGCACVGNYLQVSPVMRDGRMVTQIDAAGAEVVSGQVLCLDGTGQEPEISGAATVSGSATVYLSPAVLPAPKVMTVAPAPRTVVSVPASAAPQTVVLPSRPAASPYVAAPVPPSPPTSPYLTAAPAVPPAVMPIEVPVPPAPTPPQTKTTVGSAAPAPPRPAGQAAAVPAPLPRILPPPPSRNAVLLPRDPGAPAAPAPVTQVAAAKRADREVDLLAVPTVPHSWTDLNPAPGSDPKQKAKAAGQQRADNTPSPPPPAKKKAANAPTNFATARTEPAKAEPARTLTKDELLNLPVLPITPGEKAKAAAPVPPAPVAQKTVPPAAPKLVTPAPKLVTPLPPPPAQKPAPVPPPPPAATNWATNVVVVPPAKPAPPPAKQAAAPAPAPAPVAKLPAVPEPPPVKDTWVEAVPVRVPSASASHPAPPPGGWPAAHVSRPAPVPYTTSGLVIFPDDRPPAARPPAAQPPAAKPPAAKPVAAPERHVQPVSAPAVPAAPAAPSVPAAPAVPALKPVPAAPPAPAPKATPVNTPLPTAARLKQQVERACGKLARKVEVTPTEHGLSVRVKCADAAAVQQVTERVLVQVPEMSDAKVKFEVYVGP